MEQRFKRFVILSGAKDLARFSAEQSFRIGFMGLRMTFFLVGFFLNNAAARAEAIQDKKAPAFNENTAASLEMIAERMKSLSESLAAIPELPRLDQVIQIPEDFERSNTEKEIKK